MFQLWKLILLCGLLTGTSASLLEDLGNDVVSKLKPVLDKGLETVDSTLGPILQKLKADLEALQESTSWQEAQQKIQKAENLLDKVLSKIFQVVEKVMGLKISNVHILDIKFEVTLDGKGASLSIPITTNTSHIMSTQMDELKWAMPLLDELVDLGLNLDLQTSVSIETDAKTGVSTFPPFSSPVGLVNEAMNTVVKLMRKTVSLVVQ
ncbi:hypothetical protein EI555_004950 [Monodon monoceros]|uniref:Lipid-binding serum glycoprotein N-terminal domain-containing protein n=1 Tax=Monodon monoceros TaxID=40151 RepID=A0A4V5P8L2_MONMO|nr:hypothetical protein EI555_004950 [Monodon monoceros]